MHHIKAHILEASTAEEGIFLALQKQPEIVVTDFSLGVEAMNGLEAAQQIKTYFPNCGIIMLTSWDLRDVVPKDEQGAINYFINKGDLCEDLCLLFRKS